MWKQKTKCANKKKKTVIPALWKLWEEKCQLEANLGYIARYCFNKTKIKMKIKQRNTKGTLGG